MVFKKQKLTALDLNHIPQHVAIIMDGNGRWAQRRGLPRSAGHSAGSEAFRRAADYMSRIGVSYLTIYAFSTENWKRPEDEVASIMRLLEKYLKEAADELIAKNLRLSFLGETAPLSQELRDLIARTDKLSEQTTGMHVNVCLNYGGRDELLRAVRTLAGRVDAGELSADAITEDMISESLYTGGIPDPDLLIRPGGELRLSNFLLWQSAYTEFYFTDTLWPDIKERELEAALLEFQRRKRRFGGI